MKKRNIAVCIILSLVTFGIYGIYWFVQLNNDIQNVANPPKRTSAIVAILLGVITAGIYWWFWAKKMGDYLDIGLKNHNLPEDHHGTLYLILHILGLGIVAWCMMQS